MRLVSNRSKSLVPKLLAGNSILQLIFVKVSIMNFRVTYWCFGRVLRGYLFLQILNFEGKGGYLFLSNLGFNDYLLIKAV